MSVLFCSGCARPHVDDWPTWRHDASRSGATRENLPRNLHLQWTLQLPPLEPAWPDQDRLAFDVAYEPIVADGRLFIASPLTGALTAYSADNGSELWRFYADGPLRFAPTAYGGKVYAASDDGFLYCLAASDGKLLWKFRSGPDDRRVLGNKRMISAWPTRGAPVVADGKLWFASGIWPFMGVFLYALDAETGAVIWSNDAAGVAYTLQPHDTSAFAGIAPQGYLALLGERLLVPNGRAVPACFDRSTGELRRFLLADSQWNGGFAIAGADDVYFNGGMLFSADTGAGTWLPSRGPTNYYPLPPRMPEPVLADGLMYASFKGRLGAFRMKMADDVDVRKKPTRRPEVAGIWAIKSGGRIQLKAGPRLYCSEGPDVFALDARGSKHIVWKATVDSPVESMIAAHGRLYVSTREGKILCFARAKVVPRVIGIRRVLDKSVTDRWYAETPGLLKAAGATEGYCLALGLGAGRLVEEILQQSKLHVVALEPDPEKANSLRARFEDRGYYGDRVEVIVADPADAALPPYFASLIVSEQPIPDEVKDNVLNCLRPYGGALVLIKDDGSLDIVRRDGPLPGAGEWTHQYADASNTILSQDDLVKLPLGLLWFGGPTHENVLPRHGHGPSPQVMGGRLFIEGADGLSARDVYTGRVLWEVKLPRLGAAYDTVEHQPGANAIGGNFACAPDGVYVVYGDRWLRLDPATGKTLAEFPVPPEPAAGEKPDLAFVAVSDDILIAGVSPMAFDWDPDFRPEHFNLLVTRKTISKVVDLVDGWVGGPIIPHDNAPRTTDFCAKNLDAALNDPDLARRIPHAVRAAVDCETIEQRSRKAIEAYLGKRPIDVKYDTTLRRLNRRWLEDLYPVIPRRRRGQPGYFNSDRTTSRTLVAMDRHTGAVLWQRTAVHGFRHNSICIGVPSTGSGPAAGKVFVIDRLPDPVLRIMKFRGEKLKAEARIEALDARTGETLWSIDNDVFGAWLGYSAKRGILLESGRPSSDMLMDEPSNRMAAFRAADGALLWDKPNKYWGPCILFGDTILSEGDGYSLLTGDEATWTSPLTGATLPLEFKRAYGCNSPIAARHIVTFRSGAAGYFDIDRMGGTGNLGGFKSGCTPNLIPADGVLSAPDYTRTCACSYQNQTSLAFVHAPDVEMWTWGRFTDNATSRIRRIGVNLGAPGDRRDESGTLWLEYPFVGGPTPRVTITSEPETTRWYYRHSSRIAGLPAEAGEKAGEGLKWVAASGARGLTDLTVRLLAGAEDSKPYVVRLYFAEPDALAPGDRVFDVALQGRPVLEGFDVAKEAGGPGRIVVREFRGVDAGESLKVTLTPVPMSKRHEAILSGVEIIADGW